MITIHGISKEFKEGITGKRVKAIEAIDLEIARGEVFGFLGPNGAGKSTTIKILMNIIFPDTGKAEIGAKDVRDPAARKIVGYLPENPYFYDYFTTDELLWFGGSGAGMDPNNIRGGQARADPQSSVADLADHRAFLSQQTNLLLLAESELAQPMREFRRSQ